MAKKGLDENLVKLREFFESPRLSHIVMMEEKKTPAISLYHKAEKECIKKHIGNKIGIVLDVG